MKLSPSEINVSLWEDRQVIIYVPFCIFAAHSGDFSFNGALGQESPTPGLLAAMLLLSYRIRVSIVPKIMMLPFRISIWHSNLLSCNAINRCAESGFGVNTVDTSFTGCAWSWRNSTSLNGIPLSVRVQFNDCEVVRWTLVMQSLLDWNLLK